MTLTLTPFEGQIGDTVVIHRRARHGPVDHSGGVRHVREVKSLWSAQAWQSPEEYRRRAKKKVEVNIANSGCPRRAFPFSELDMD